MKFVPSDEIIWDERLKDDGKDPIRPWFQASVDLGDHIGVRFGYIPPRSSEPEWYYLSHSDYDGIGGLADILRERGYEPGPLPTIPHETEPSWWPFFRSLPKYLTSRDRVEWRKPFGNPRVPDSQVPPESVAWHVFDETDTARIIEACRGREFTVNSFLLSGLGSALFVDVAESTERMKWMVPVNLRGKVTRTRDSENHVSFVTVPMERLDDPSTVHRKIYGALEKGDHWANWNAYTATLGLPHGLKRALVRMDRATSELMVGAFSNIGTWNGNGEFDLEGDWLFAPPAMRFFKIAAGCVTWRGRLSLCMHLHPEISSDPADAKAWVDAWVREIQAAFE